MTDKYKCRATMEARNNKWVSYYTSLKFIINSYFTILLEICFRLIDGPIDKIRQARSDQRKRQLYSVTIYLLMSQVNNNLQLEKAQGQCSRIVRSKQYKLNLSVNPN